jgi:hypothetical protein
MEHKENSPKREFIAIIAYIKQEGFHTNNPGFHFMVGERRAN